VVAKTALHLFGQHISRHWGVLTHRCQLVQLRPQMVQSPSFQHLLRQPRRPHLCGITRKRPTGNAHTGLWQEFRFERGGESTGKSEWT
jgi:hypothetical protein